MADHTKDRLARLLDQEPPVVNGIDFVEIANDEQTELRVHFLLDTPDLIGTVASSDITITGGETIPTVPVQSLDWLTAPDQRPVLRLRVAVPGDFSRYMLKVVSTLLDPFFDHTELGRAAGR